MKRHTGIIVIVLLALIIVNNIYYPVGHMVEGMNRLEEGFDIHSKWGNNEQDTRERYIISVNPILKKEPGQTDLVFLKAQLLNILKMFNANFEAYIQKVYNTKDFLNPNISVDLINNVITQLFDNIIILVDSTKKTDDDNTLTDDVRKSIKTYFLNGFTQMFEKLTSLKNKPEMDAKEISLFTKEQITDPDYHGEPSIKHFVIICDEGSSLAKQLNSSKVDPTGVHMEFFISNTINNANNNNFLLKVTKDTATLKNTQLQFSDYAAPSLKYAKNAGQSDPTLANIWNDLKSSNIDVYKITESNTSGLFIAVLFLIGASALAVGYYFYDAFGGSAVSSAVGNGVTSVYTTASNTVSSAASNVSSSVSGMSSNMSQGVSTESLNGMMNDAGGGLYLIHVILLAIIIFLFFKYHGGDGLSEIKHTIEDTVNKVISEATDQANDMDV